MDEIINQEEFERSGIRLKARLFLALQVLAFLSACYLAYDPFDFVFDETRWLLMFIGVLVYLLFFILLTLRIAFKKELRIAGAQAQLTMILIFAVIPGFILMLVTLNDIF